MIRRLIGLAVCCVALIVLQTGMYPAIGHAEGVLRIGVTANRAPLVYKEKGKVIGLESEMGNELAQALGKEAQFVELGWEELIPALLDNKIDIIMSGMTITDMRRMRVDFSEPYLIIGQMALVRATDAGKYRSVRAIVTSEARVGVEKGTTGDIMVQREFTKAKRVGFTSLTQGAESLMRKKIDMFIHDAPVIFSLAAENEAKGLTVVNDFFTQEFLGWAMRKGDGELRASVNAILQEWKNSRKLDQVIFHWIPAYESIAQQGYKVY